MKAPSEMRCSVVPQASSMGNDTATVRISPTPMIMPLRSPIVKMSTKMTIATDSTRLSMKDDMAASTLSGWKKIFSVSKPAGTFFMTSARRLSTARPTSGTMADDSMATHIASAGSRPTKNPLRCGST